MHARHELAPPLAHALERGVRGSEHIVLLLEQVQHPLIHERVDRGGRAARACHGGVEVWVEVWVKVLMEVNGGVDRGAKGGVRCEGR